MSKQSVSKNKRTARIFIVDDHPVVREGLSLLIDHEPDMVLCGGAKSAPEARATLSELNPDAVVVDLTLKEGSGLELIKDIRARYPELPVLVLSMRDESLFAERALRAGAHGYVMKEAAGASLIAALKTILRGEIYLSDTMSRRILKRLVGTSETDETDEMKCLTDRELEVFRMLGNGMTTRAIAKNLHRSVKTIESHRENIKHKLGCQDAVELVQRAVCWVEENGG